MEDGGRKEKGGTDPEAELVEGREGATILKTEVMEKFRAADNRAMDERGRIETKMGLIFIQNLQTSE